MHAIIMQGMTMHGMNGLHAAGSQVGRHRAIVIHTCEHSCRQCYASSHMLQDPAMCSESLYSVAQAKGRLRGAIRCTLLRALLSGWSDRPHRNAIKFRACLVT